MEFDKEYYWVVLCKNNLFHYRQNRSTGHRILLGETDAVLPAPHLRVPFKAICDDCGKEYTYVPSELLRSDSCRYQILPAREAGDRVRPAM